MCPDASITNTVESSDMTIIAVRKFCITSQDSSRPTVAGMNIIGIICMRKCPVSLTDESLTTPMQSAVKRMSIPYMLAGTGSGMVRLSSSPNSEIASIISNCLMYFMVMSGV